MATNPEHQTIEFTPEKLRRFREAYDKAKMNPLTDVFEFEGHEFVLTYAHYMIEYLEQKLGTTV